MWEIGTSFLAIFFRALPWEEVIWQALAKKCNYDFTHSLMQMYKITDQISSTRSKPLIRQVASSGSKEISNSNHDITHSDTMSRLWTKTTLPDITYHLMASLLLHLPSCLLLTLYHYRHPLHRHHQICHNCYHLYPRLHLVRLQPAFQDPRNLHTNHLQTTVAAEISQLGCKVVIRHTWLRVKQSVESTFPIWSDQMMKPGFKYKPRSLTMSKQSVKGYSFVWSGDEQFTTLAQTQRFVATQINRYNTENRKRYFTKE